MPVPLRHSDLASSQDPHIGPIRHHAVSVILRESDERMASRRRTYTCFADIQQAEEETLQDHVRRLETRIAQLEKAEPKDHATLETVLRAMHAHLRSNDGVDPIEFSLQHQFPIDRVYEAISIFQERNWLASDDEE